MLTTKDSDRPLEPAAQPTRRLSQRCTSSVSERGIPRWKLLLLVLAAGFVPGILIPLSSALIRHNWTETFFALDGLNSVLAFTGLAAAAVVVILWKFRAHRSFLAACTATGGVVGVILFQSIRIESFNGNLTPRFAWRWTLPAEQNFERYKGLRSTSVQRGNEFDAAFWNASKSDPVQFMGAQRNAVSAIELAPTWDQRAPKQLWRHPVGMGWSSFAVSGRAAINLEQRGDSECVVCYDLVTGDEIWCHEELTKFENMHGDGPRSTPSIYDDRVLSIGATGLLTCVELRSGELLWKRDTLETQPKEKALWGISGSPLVFQNNVFVTPSAGNNGAAIAYSVDSGAEVWRCGDDPVGYSSPVVSQVSGEMQLLSFNGAGLRGYSLDGQSRWFHSWITQGESRVNVAQPVVVSAGEDQVTRVLISSGYDRGTALLKIEQRDSTWAVTTEWTSRALKSKMSNFVVLDNHIYGLDGGILCCLSLQTGERLWKRGRYGHGQLILVNQTILIQAESGEVALVAATPEGHSERCRFTALDNKTWNHPTLAGNILIVRNDREAAAYELPTPTTQPIRETFAGGDQEHRDFTASLD